MRQASILLVEDEALIRMMLVDMIEEIGHKVVAEAGNVEGGVSLAQTEDYDLAILDINLHGALVTPVAEAVKARGRPLFFVSGYGPGGVPEGLEGVPVLTKPCAAEVLSQTINRMLSNG